MKLAVDHAAIFVSDKIEVCHGKTVFVVRTACRGYEGVTALDDVSSR